MQVAMSSGNYDIIANDEAFLFGPNEDLTVQVIDESELLVRIVLKFVENDSGEFDIYNDIVDESLIITCVNFDGLGTGLKRPVHIADSNGKEIYFMFSSTLHRNMENRIRSVKYTLFREK